MRDPERLRPFRVVRRVVVAERRGDRAVAPQDRGRERVGVQLVAVLGRHDRDRIGITQVEGRVDGRDLGRRKRRAEHESQLVGFDRQVELVPVGARTQRRRDLRGRERHPRRARDHRVRAGQEGPRPGRGGVDRGLTDSRRHLAQRKVEIMAGSAAEQGPHAPLRIGAQEPVSRVRCHRDNFCPVELEAAFDQPLPYGVRPAVEEAFEARIVVVHDERHDFGTEAPEHGVGHHRDRVGFAARVARSPDRRVAIHGESDDARRERERLVAGRDADRGGLELSAERVDRRARVGVALAAHMSAVDADAGEDRTRVHDVFGHGRQNEQPDDTEHDPTGEHEHPSASRANDRGCFRHRRQATEG